MKLNSTANPLPPSDEDVATVLKELENLKNTQPEVFKELLQSLGMATETELQLNGKEAISNMTKSIMQMRASELKDGLPETEISLTGNKPKVSHHLSSFSVDLINSIF